MDVAGALGEAAEKLGVVAAAAAAAAALVAPRVRLRALAMGCAIVLAAVVLLAHIWDSDQFRSISGDATTFAAMLVFGLAVVGALGALFVRSPALFPLLAVAAVPFRVPIEAAGSTSNLLVPLYFVIAGGAASYVWRHAAPGPGTAPRRPGAIEATLAVFVSLYALQSLYSRDFPTALEQVVFFYVPFAVLFVLLTEVRWTPRLLAGSLAVLAGLALVFSGIGFFEYADRELLWNPKVISSNQFESYFRVNSVFWDPNVYGRFLGIVMVAVAAVLLWSRDRRAVVATAAVLAVLWGGLVLTFSQSSFVSLLAGLAVLAALRWDARRTAAATAIAAALAAVFLLAFQDTLKVELGSSSGLNEATSGRVDLIQGGLELFVDRPLWGYGSGAFARTYRQKQKGNQEQAVSASHTLPVTVAAEQGVLGLIAYATLLIAAFMTLLGRAATGRSPPAAEADGSLRPHELPALRAARAALTAAYATLVVHTMMYAAFLEDPLAWVIPATGLALAPYLASFERRRGAAEPTARPAPATAC